MFFWKNKFTLPNKIITNSYGYQALSFLWYAIGGNYELSVMIPTSIGTLLGGLVGAKLLGILPVKAVTILFALLQAFAGAWMLLIKGA